MSAGHHIPSPSRYDGLRLSIADDHLERFIEDELVVSINPCVFEKVPQYPADQSIRCAALFEGHVKLEQGNSAWPCEPQRSPCLVKLVAGWASELAQVKTQDEIVVSMNRIDSRTRRNEKHIDRAVRTIAQTLGRDDWQL